MRKAGTVIIGGGITGLACAYRLKQKGCKDFLLLEKNERLGGTIQTTVKNGFLMEKGPDSFLSEKPQFLSLLESVGMGGDVINTNLRYRRSYIVKKNRLHALPEGFYLVAPSKFRPFILSPLLSPLGKLRVLAEPFVPAKKRPDESVAAFISRRLGKEMLERIGQPMVAGIYTGDPAQLSAHLAVPRLVAFEERYGSLLKGLWRARQSGRKTGRDAGPRYSLFLSLKNGLSSAVDKLAQSIGTDHILKGCGVESLSLDRKTNRWHIKAGDQSFECRHLCLALPSWATANLMQNEHPGLSQELRQIPFESVAVLNIGYKRHQIGHDLQGFGFVVPAKEKSSLVACSFSSVKFAGRAPADSALFRVFVGGAFGKETVAMDDARLITKVTEELKRFLSVDGDPLFVELTRYNRSMPQYYVGHRERVARIRGLAGELPGLVLSGASYEGVGLPDCVRQAGEAADQIFKNKENTVQVN